MCRSRRLQRARQGKAPGHGARIHLGRFRGFIPSRRAMRRNFLCLPNTAAPQSKPAMRAVAGPSTCRMDASLSELTIAALIPSC